MKFSNLFAAMALLTLGSSIALGDDLLGDKRGGGKGSGGGSGGSSGGGSKPPAGKPDSTPESKPPRPVNSGGGGSGGGKPDSKPPAGKPDTMPPVNNGGGQEGRPPRPVNSGGGSGGSGGGQGTAEGRPPRPVNSGSGSSEGRPPRPVSGNDNPMPPVRTGGGSTRVESRPQGRSGTSRYGSQNNTTSRSPAIVVDSVPRVSHGTIGGQARYEDRLPNNSRYRRGYSHYRQDWCDDYFAYPFYQFDYNPRYAVISPFYCYSSMPGYISYQRVRFGCDLIRFDRVDRWNWDYNRNYRSGSLEYALDNAVDSIYRMFRYRDMRALDYVVHDRDWVVMRGDWGDHYEISSYDFYDMMQDLIYGCNTHTFVIRSVERCGYDARVFADHTYRDSWGYTRVVRLEFVLSPGGERGTYYFIREFSSSLGR